MLKANAYGHGAEFAARVLAESPDLYGFGLATFEEAVALRTALKSVGRRVSLFVFSEATPWTEQKGVLCEQFGVTPVLSSWLDFEAFVAQGWPARVSYELKFNTGLNRLGIELGRVSAVRKKLATLDSGALPNGICSHLASSEAPDAKITALQLDKFASLRRELSAVAPSAQFHLANSGGLWNFRELGLPGLTDIVRPGLALYGVTPWDGAPARGLQSVLTWRASVVATHTLKPGESLGYGGTFAVPRGASDSVQVAILAAGYADGVQRQWSGRPGNAPGGWVWLAGRPERFLGRVSMDLSAVSCSRDVEPGAEAEILGTRVDPWAQARAAETIPYELFTSIGSRVARREQ